MKLKDLIKYRPLNAILNPNQHVQSNLRQKHIFLLSLNYYFGIRTTQKRGEVSLDLSELLVYINRKISQNEKIIEFPEEIIVFQTNSALDQFESILRNETHPNNFYEDFRNSKAAVQLDGLKNLVIDGKGAVIHVHGMLIPFYLENCENICLRNFTIQYDTLTHSEGIVIRRRVSSFDVQIKESIKNHDSVPIMAWIEYNSDTRLLGKKEAYANVQGKMLKPNIISIPIPSKFQNKVPKQGQGIVLRHIITHHAGIQLYKCKNIKIHNIEVKEAYWGALLAHKVENLIVDDLRVIPREGKIFSTNADACHLISCSGLVSFEKCRFEGHGDDALNVHTLYYSIVNISNLYEMVVQLKIQQQDRIMDYPDEGDLMEFTRLKGLKGYTTLTLSTVKVDKDTKKIHLRFKDPIPTDLMKSDVLANISKSAKVKFVNNNIHNNRARGILIQSRDVLIENNTFSNCTGTGIYITCSKYWWEALSSKNIQILNNKLFECGEGPGTMGASGISVTTEPPMQVLGTHENILIDGNIIESSSSKLPSMYFRSVSSLELRNNNVSNKIIVKKCDIKE